MLTPPFAPARRGVAIVTANRRSAGRRLFLTCRSLLGDGSEVHRVTDRARLAAGVRAEPDAEEAVDRDRVPARDGIEPRAGLVERHLGAESGLGAAPPEVQVA